MTDEPKKVVLPVVRRVMPTIISDDIKGVAPMCAPIWPPYSIAAARTKAVDELMAGGMSFEEALAEINKP